MASRARRATSAERANSAQESNAQGSAKPSLSRWPATTFTLVAVISAVAAVVVTWRRLFVGMDLQDESYYVLLPWRWVLGDRPFVHEQNMMPFPGMLTYPFVKVFGLLRGNDPTGLMLYTRHLYLLLMVATATAVFLLLRRLVRWPLALLVATVYVTYIFWATPQLSYNTLALAFLTLSAAFGARVLIGAGGARSALAAGAALGVAVVAYPSLLVLTPFFAVLLTFAQGRRAVAVIARGAFVQVPDPPGPPTGREAWRTLRMWVLGGLAVLVPTGLIALSFGPKNLVRSWQNQMAGARTLGQLGGSAKALVVAQGVERFVTLRPYLLIAALVIYLVYRRYPKLGRALLALVPVALWLAGQPALMAASGYVLIYSLLAPYLYLFIPKERREVGARLMIGVWAPSVLAGAMAAYTSAAGYVNAAVGLSAGLMVSGLFLAFSLEALTPPFTSVEEQNPEPDSGGEGGRSRIPAVSSLHPWLALVVLAAIVAVTVSFQFQFQQRDVPYGELTSRFRSGPWWGIAVTPERRALLDGFEVDLREEARPDDKLLIFFAGEGYYLYWRGEIAANIYWMGSGPAGGLPTTTIEYYRKYGTVPTLVVHLTRTEAMSEPQLAAADAGLGYAVTLVRPDFIFYRKPGDVTATEVIRRLLRE